MWIIFLLGVVAALVLLVISPFFTWRGIERSLDDDEVDCDRTRECEQNAGHTKVKGSQT